MWLWHLAVAFGSDASLWGPLGPALQQPCHQAKVYPSCEQAPLAHLMAYELQMHVNLGGQKFLKFGGARVFPVLLGGDRARETAHHHIWQAQGALQNMHMRREGSIGVLPHTGRAPGPCPSGETGMCADLLHVLPMLHLLHATTVAPAAPAVSVMYVTIVSMNCALR